MNKIVKKILIEKENLYSEKIRNEIKKAHKNMHVDKSIY